MTQSQDLSYLVKGASIMYSLLCSIFCVVCIVYVVHGDVFVGI